MKCLRGIYTAMVTPFDAQGSLALEPIAPFLEFQADTEINGVVVSGTTGEGISLSVMERNILLDTVIRFKGSLTVIAGTGAASITDAINLTRHASEVGANAVLVLPPFFFKSPTIEGLLAYYRKILDASDIPVLLYNIPQFTAVNITNPLLDELLGHDNLVGIKDSAGDWTRTQELITRYPDLQVFSGSDLLLSKTLSAGGAGAISGITNAFPNIMVTIKQAHMAGAPTDTAQSQVNAIQALLAEYPPIASIKSLLKVLGFSGMHVRPPLIDLKPDEVESLLLRLGEVGVHL